MKEHYYKNIAITNAKPRYNFNNSKLIIQGAKIKGRKVQIVEIMHPNMAEPGYDGRNWIYPAPFKNKNVWEIFSKTNYEVAVKEEYDLDGELPWYVQGVLDNCFE